MNFSEFFSLPVFSDMFKPYLNKYDYALIRAALGEQVDVADLREAASRYSTRGLLEKYFTPSEIRRNIWDPKVLFQSLDDYEWLKSIITVEDICNLICNYSCHVSANMEVFVKIFEDFPEFMKKLITGTFNKGDEMDDQKIEYIISTYPGAHIEQFIENAQLRHRYATGIDWSSERTRRDHYGKVELCYCWDHNVSVSDIEILHTDRLYSVNDFEIYSRALLENLQSIEMYISQVHDKARAIQFAIQNYPDKVSREYWELAIYDDLDILAANTHLATPIKTVSYVVNSEKVFTLAYRLYPEQVMRLLHRQNRLIPHIFDWLVKIGARWDMKTRELTIGCRINAVELPSADILRKYYYYSDASSEAARELARQYQGINSDIIEYLELGFQENIDWLREVATTSESSRERIYALRRLLDIELSS